MAQGSPPNLTAQNGRRPWLRALAIAAGGLAIGGATACWWGYSLARRELPQFLQRNLSDALGRPIKVGEFERFSPTGVRLGPSIVPPTEADFSWVRAQSLEVNFNPIELLLTRTLRPSVVFIEPQVALKQGFDGEWRLQPPQSVGEDGFFRTELRGLQIRNASLSIGPLSRTSIVELPEGVTSATLVQLENVNLRVRFSGPDNQTASVVVGGRLNNGAFQLRAEGQIDTRQVNVAVQAQQLPIESVNPLFGGRFFVRDGLLSSNLDLRYRPQAEDPLTVTGTARLRNGDIVIGELPSALQAINGTVVLDGVGGSLENSSLKFGPILVKAAGGIDFKKGHNLDITIPEVSLAQVSEALARPLPVEAAGRFRVESRVTGPLRSPQVSGDLANLGTVTVDRIGLDGLTAQFAATLDELTLRQATLRPTTGGTVTAQGRALLNGALGGDRTAQRPPDLSLTAQTDLPLDGLIQRYGLRLPSGLRLGPLVAEARIFGPLSDLRGEAAWQLPQATTPGRGRARYASRQLQATDTVLRVGEGVLRAEATADLQSRGWRAAIAGDRLGLASLSPQLRGTLDTDLRASGSLDALNPQGIRAGGTARFSHAVPVNPNRVRLGNLNLGAIDRVLPGALSTRFAWTGQGLEIAEAATANLSAQGSVAVEFLNSVPQLGPVDLAARLANIDLGAAYGLVNGPAWLRPGGTLAFDGTLRGTLAAPRLAGTLGLSRVGLNDITLVNGVSGPVRVSLSEGATIALRGDGEELSASVAPDLRPNAFRFASGDLQASGQRRGDSLAAELSGFELGMLGLRLPFGEQPPSPDLGLVGGVLSATASLDLRNLQNPGAIAQFAIARPALGGFGGDRLSGQLRYRDGLALLTNGQLDLTPTTQFMVTGTGQLFPQWQAQAEITTAGADFQDLLSTLNLYSYADFGRLLTPPPLGSARDLAVTPVGQPNAPLLEQAALAQELRTAQASRASQRARALLPGLDQLEGRIAGTLGVSASASAGLAADFDFAGQNWAWGRYDFDNQFTARGRLRDRTLSLEPVEFRAGNTRLSLVGDLSAVESNLAIAAEGLPLAAAATLLESPIDVAGLLNLEAQLTGSFTNPRLAGGLAIAEAQVNRQPMTEISSQFQYADAVLNLDGRVVGPVAEAPLTFGGTVPYALPFVAVQPPTDQMDLQVSLKDDAFALVNVLTPAVVWGGGGAEVDLRLRGTPRRPLLSGLIAFDDASFQSPFLGASLDRLSGTLQLQGTQIRTDGITGRLYDGTVSLTGQLPLTRQDSVAGDGGLRLALGDLTLNYANEARSQIDGEITLRRALLAPVVGGQVELQNTQIAVGRELLALGNRLMANVNVERLRASLTQVRPFLPVEVDNLTVALGATRLRAIPLLSLELEGAVTVDGPLPGLTADGAIALTDGWINTATAEFFLEPSHLNQVIFRPEDALDPYLDLVLAASLPLQRSYNINTLNSTTGAAEVPTLDRLGAATILDELQIEARVQGQASRLLANLPSGLSLTSAPPYTQEELLGMVSGGYLGGLGGGEPGLALGTNLAGAFIAEPQDAIARSLGLRRLRLVGTTVLPSEAKDTLGLGVGVTAGITENLSATLVQVLNQNQPLALNARYRIDDNWSISGSTNAGSQGRAFVEYRLSF